MSKKYTCPRRIAEGRASENSPLRHDGPNKDSWDKNHQCSYDGSLSGEKFMEYVRNGGKVDPTDKSYKFYVDEYEGPVRGAKKFYTHHLSESQGREFFDLWKAGRVNWGYPGYPYVALYLPGPSDSA